MNRSVKNSKISSTVTRRSPQLYGPFARSTPKQWSSIIKKEIKDTTQRITHLECWCFTSQK